MIKGKQKLTRRLKIDLVKVFIFAVVARQLMLVTHIKIYAHTPTLTHIHTPTNQHTHSLSHSLSYLCSHLAAIFSHIETSPFKQTLVETMFTNKQKK